MSGKHRTPNTGKRLSNGDWLAYGISALIVLVAIPALWELALNIYAYVLFPRMGEIWVLAYIVCGLLILISFFGLAIILSFGTRLIVFQLLSRGSR